MEAVNEKKLPRPGRVRVMVSFAVGVSEYAIKRDPARIITYGLGSCLAIALYSKNNRIGSMAHVMLPVAFDRVGPLKPGKYADTAVSAMLRGMKEKGIRSQDLVAKLAGGAEMFPGSITRRIGARNALSARKTLRFYGIKILSEDIGGDYGRSVEFFLDSGDLQVRTLKGAVIKI